MTMKDNLTRILTTTRTSFGLACDGPLHIPAHKQRDPKAVPGQFRPRVAALMQPWPEPHPIEPVGPDSQDVSWL